MVAQPDIIDLRDKLLAWYKQTKRPLPWRRSQDGYQTLVSEAMLQQTQVKTVIPYFERFLKRFPTIDSLANATEKEVLTYWSGLGYYRRARNLRLAAKQVKRNYQGKLPTSVTALEELPGVGPYTARAVASISAGQAVGVVDGNVVRVLSRIFEIDADVTRTPTKRLLQNLADQLVDPDRPGNFNQALMELGATVCKPQQPDCQNCPIAQHCGALQHNLVTAYPPRKKRAATVLLKGCAILITDSPAKNFLVSKHLPSEIRKEGVWDIPVILLATDYRKALNHLANEQNINLAEVTRVGNVQHAIMQRRFNLHLLLGRLEEKYDIKSKKASETAWLSLSAPHNLPISGLTLKAIRLYSRQIETGQLAR